MTKQTHYKFIDLENAPLTVDAIYEGGRSGTGSKGDEPIHKIFKNMGIGNSGGFRISKVKGVPAFVVLHTTGKSPEWPDDFDSEVGVFSYYGDNKKPGNELDSPQGNRLLSDIFIKIDGTEDDRKKIPPFLIFKSTGKGHDVKFLGLACPGRKFKYSEDLIALWRQKSGSRFQNYKAYFTILDIGRTPLDKRWFQTLYDDQSNSMNYAPKVWKDFIKNGRHSIKPLVAFKIDKIRKKKDQLPKEKLEWDLLNTLYNYFEDGWAFEKCAPEILRMLDPKFTDIEITRHTKDGGFDAIGEYYIGDYDNKLNIKWYLEVKKYKPSENVCGVKETSRLISRIKIRQFGIFLTTSWVGAQAYKEIIEDNHPIMIISGGDIARILKRSEYNTIKKLKIWLENNFAPTK